MKSRLFAVVAAVLLALIGGVLVLTYAQGADQRAVRNLDPVDVLVVNKAVPAGSSVETVKAAVVLEQLPGTAVAKTALKTLDGATGKVTSTDLVPGEQLLTERLVDPPAAGEGGSVKVPAGFQEVSFQLDPQRVVGGHITAGDHVGIAFSFKDGADKAKPAEPTSQITLRKVLVTAVQRAPQPSASAKPADSTSAQDSSLPQGSLIVTVGVNDVDANKIIFASEFGSLWLTKEPPDAQNSGPRIERRDVVYK